MPLIDLAVGALALALIVTSVGIQRFGPESAHNASALAAATGGEYQDARADDLQSLPTSEQRSQDVATALDATHWTSAEASSFDALFANATGQSLQAPPIGCLNGVLVESELATCTGGTPDGDTTVVVAGDSVAMSWVPTIETLGAARGWNVISFGYGNCSLIDVPVTDANGSQAFTERCNKRRAEMRAEIDGLGPDIVFTSSADSALVYAQTSRPVEDAWRDGATATLEHMSNVDQVVMLENPPMGKDPRRCATRFSTPADCFSEPAGTHTKKVASEKAAIETASNATYVDTRAWFCVRDTCPATTGGLTTRADTSHMTNATAVQLARAVDEALSEELPD